jgi:hypothetical protein
MVPAIVNERSHRGQFFFFNTNVMWPADMLKRVYYRVRIVFCDINYEKFTSCWLKFNKLKVKEKSVVKIKIRND